MRLVDALEAKVAQLGELDDGMHYVAFKADDITGHLHHSVSTRYNGNASIIERIWRIDLGTRLDLPKFYARTAPGAWSAGYTGGGGPLDLEIGSILWATWWSPRDKPDNSVASLEERRKIQRLMQWGMSEYVHSLNILDDLLIRAEFRAHGHGEQYLEVMDLSSDDPQWIDIQNGLNADFGRECDSLVRGKLAHTDSIPPILVKLARMMDISLPKDPTDIVIQVGDILLGQCLDGINIEDNKIEILVRLDDCTPMPVKESIMLAFQRFQQELFYGFYDDVMKASLPELVKYWGPHSEQLRYYMKVIQGAAEEAQRIEEEYRR